MKKWMYLIFPAVMLGVFLFFYQQDMAQVALREQARADAIAKDKADADAKKKSAEDQARVSAEKRANDQKDADDKLAADREAKWQADSKKIKDETDRNTTDADRYSKEGSELEIQLEQLHQQRETLNREDFDLLKKVELTRVDQQNADMEILRKVEMIARRADDSSMTAMPPPPQKEKE